MKLKYYLLLVVIIFMSGSRYTLAHALDKPPSDIKPEFTEPQTIVSIYMKAVNRGELIVFDRKINMSMITPIRVEYVYELNNTTPKVKVYSEIKQPIPVQNLEGCKIKGVSSILDNNGHIIDTAVHISND